MATSIEYLSITFIIHHPPGSLSVSVMYAIMRCIWPPIMETMLCLCKWYSEAAFARVGGAALHDSISRCVSAL